MNLPAFLEVTPDSFKPLEECTRAEVLSAAAGYMTHAAMDAADAVSEAENSGKSPISEDSMTTSETNHALAQALERYAETL